MKNQNNHARIYATLLLATTCVYGQNSIVPNTNPNLDAGFLEKQQEILTIERSLKENPNQLMAQFNVAQLYNDVGQIDNAIEAYEKAIILKPDCTQAYYNKGLCLHKKNRKEEAIQAFAIATIHDPKHLNAYLQQASLHETMKNTTEAIVKYKKALEINPNIAGIPHRLGKLLREKDEFEEAEKYIRHAYNADPENTAIMFDLAATLHLLEFEKVPECVTLYSKIIEKNPNSIEALYNLGYTVKKLGHFPEAITIYDQVLKKRPDYALALFSRSLAYLTLGDFTRGWRDYESRWQAYNHKPRSFANSTPWDGSDLNGKRIFVYAEQGLGDTFQFIRYLKNLKDMGAYVIFQSQPPLKDLLSLCPYIDEVYAQNEKISIPVFDAYAPLLSLPYLLETQIDTIPHEIPYIFADEELVDEWREKLSHDKNFKIGLCWQGNSRYTTQFLRQAVAGKSMPAEIMSPIGKLPGVSLYSIQKINGEEQLANWPKDVTINTFGPDFDESNGRFMDTVSIMKNLDLVISIDTSICHCAASLGVPTWNLLPNPADWRWMINTNKTPWYSNMRLFKQHVPGDWKSAIDDVIVELKKILPQYKNSSATHTKPSTPKQLNTTSNKKAELIKKLHATNAELEKLNAQLSNTLTSGSTNKVEKIMQDVLYARNQKQYLQKRIEAL